MGSEPSVEGSEAGGAEEGSEARRADAIERVGRTSGPVMAAGALAVVAAVVAAYVGLAHWGLAESSEPARFSGGPGSAPPGGGRADGRDRVAPTCLDGRRRPKRLRDRPALAVKVENSPAARPQSGLEDADVVFEEIVEGGITRFLAIYDCGDNPGVAPVRSARVDDGAIARPFTRVLAYSGSNRPVENALKKHHMIRRTELGSDAFYRVPPGSTDIHSLNLDTKQLRASLAGTPAGPPKGEIFRRGAPGGKKEKTRRVAINFTPSNTIVYRFARGLWRRFEAGEAFRTRSGGPIAVPNVLVQRVKVNRSETIVDVAGNPSPDMILHGRGPVILFRNGAAIRGRWLIKGPGEAPRYELFNGKPMPFAAGPVWVELLPSRAGDVKSALAYN